MQSEDKLLVEAAVRRFFDAEVARRGAKCTQLSPRALAWLEAKTRTLIKLLVIENQDYKRATNTPSGQAVPEDEET